MNEENFLKCIVDNNRRLILKCLGSDELCVTEIVERTGLEQTLASFHLKRLKDCGLVNSRRDGKKIFYSVMDPGIRDTLDNIAKLSEGIQDCCADGDDCSK